MQEEIKLIGRRIRLLRTAKNLTQTGLAKEMGIPRTTLQRRKERLVEALRQKFFEKF